MLIARGHSDINTTLSVIMSLFCCRSLCLCISLSRCLCLFILALSRSACRRSSLQFFLLPLAMTLSSCRLSSLESCPVARYNCATLRHAISRQKVSTFHYSNSPCGLLSTTRKVRTDGSTLTS